MWQRVSTSKVHIQATGIKYIKDVYSLIVFSIESQFHKFVTFILFYTTWLSEQHVF